MRSTSLSKTQIERELSEIEFLTQESSNPDLYSILYTKFWHLIDKIPFSVYRKKPGDVVFRCRQNQNEEIFSSYKEITYPPKEYITEYGRANFPHESIFYGCIPSQVKEDQDSINAYNACVLEADKELLTDKHIQFKKIYTVGKWDTRESESHFVYLPYSHKAFLRNAMIRDIVHLFENFAANHYPEKKYWK